MAQVRVLRGERVRTVGEPVGVQVSTFGLKALEGISGADLKPIIMGAAELPANMIRETWPRWTGASGDTIRIETDEVGAKHARVSIRVGGQPLIEDPRNEKHIDYAPFIEFNGSPGGTPPGTILYAMHVTNAAMRAQIHAGVRALLQARAGIRGT